MENYLADIESNEESIIEYIDADNESCLEEYHLLIPKISQISFQKRLLLFYSLTNISIYYHHTEVINDRICNILTYFKSDIQSLSTFKIFKIFHKSESIMKFLINEEIIKKEDLTGPMFKIKKYNLFPETKKEKSYLFTILPKLIEQDKVEEFISMINSKIISLDQQLYYDEFEINHFFVNKNPSMIEYAAFFGSIQITRYLLTNNFKENSLLFIYAIHGANPDLFHYIEENIKMNNKLNVLIESIKCHQINFTEYILNNHFSNQNLQQFFRIILKHYNFRLIKTIIEILDDSFYYLCKYDYSEIVEFLVKSGKFDHCINKINILLFTFIVFSQNDFNKISQMLFLIQFLIYKINLVLILIV